MGRDLTRRQLIVGSGVIGVGTLASGCADGELAVPLLTNVPVPRPADLIRTNWSADVFSFGAYSFMRAGATPDDRAAVRQSIADRLFFAGEHTSVDFPSTVHGAMASGRRAADDLLLVAQNNERVVVVGAGISAVTCAAALAASSMDVTVLEARDRVGGRLNTVEPTGWGMPIDRGASWVHDVDASDLVERLDAAGVTSGEWDWEDVRSAAVSDGDAAAIKIATTIEDAAMGAVLAAEQDDDDGIDLASATRVQLTEEAVDAGAVDAVALERFFSVEIATEYGADAEQLSARWALNEGSEGDDAFVTGGYQRLAQAVADDLEVRTNSTVARIELGDATVTVTTTAGERFEADRVVVTVPLGVLQAEAIEFEPALPDGHAQAIDRLGMGVLDKFWFRFDTPWWSEESAVWSITERIDSPFVEWYNLLPLTGEPILLALLGGDTARQWSIRTDLEVTDAAIVALQRFADAGW